MAQSSAVPTWISSWMSPSLSTLAIGVVIALSIPLILHLLFYRSSTDASSPTFLLVGLSGSGKTTLLMRLERGDHVATRTSQVPLTVEASMHPATVTASSEYRSENDPAMQTEKRLLLVDTPGHGKLRHFALEHLTKPGSLSGVIFVVDATNLSEEADGEGQPGRGLREAAEYLHDVLLLLQRRSSRNSGSGVAQQLPLLVAANKLDLFTALPTPLVKSRLEAEITKVRESRSRGLLDSGISMSEAFDANNEKDWLGEQDEQRFSFAQMAGLNVPVQIAGGYAVGPDGADVRQWQSWIADQT